jgi:hypothetical protein
MGDYHLSLQKFLPIEYSGSRGCPRFLPNCCDRHSIDLPVVSVNLLGEDRDRLANYKNLG